MRRFAAAAPPPFALRKRRASRRAGVIDQSSRGRTLCHMVEVRKTVTVVFSDLAGSTAIGEGLDPESLHSLMSRYHATLRSVLELHGGTVEKFIGDAVMAVFGVPVVHEDDAMRALRAAVGMRHALAQLNVAIELEYGVSFEFRDAVTT